ncbi:protein bric-a-brac 1-like isoform X3 [Achroia grisella]|uniref:protein bric-a-brac 1-like isoform X3 n=1 Tax=Achroia grisella TaxID=688607 RepID=UPI0027D2DD66|nr:protein bric-a-brac 1-like isoform X3 [Achroia grisella]
MPAEEEPAAMESRDLDGSPQQFCLRWNNYQSNLANCFDQLLQTESFVDVTLACDGQSLKAHKVVLSACSPYFQSLFMDNPCRHPIIIMRDIKYCDLKAVVDFMYRGEINVSQDQITALLKVAETLKIRGLTDVSGEHAVLRPGGGVEPRVPKRPVSCDTDTPAKARRCASSEHDRSPRGSPGTPAAGSDLPQAAAAPGDPAAHGGPSLAALHAEDVDIRPGIAEMIREEERAKLLENSHAWLGASTSSIAADSYQYQLQSMWQKCWNTNQSLVHNLRFRERGPLKSWRPETMAEAIFSVLKEGLSLSQAARKYDIPYPTFVLYANRVHNMLGPSADGGAGWHGCAKRLRRRSLRQRSRGWRVAERGGCGCSRRRGPRAASADVQHGGRRSEAPRPPAALRPAAAAAAVAAAAVAALCRPGVPTVLPATTWPRSRTPQTCRSVPPVRLASTRQSLWRT